MSLVTSWNIGCQLVVSEFASSNIKDTLLELEANGHDMTFPFGQAAEGPEELDSNDNNDKCNDIPVAPEPLSTQDMTTCISSLKVGQGECPFLSLNISSCTQSGEGEGPLLDLEDHTSIKTSQDGQGAFSPYIDIGNGKTVSKVYVLQEPKRATFSKVPGSTDCLNQCARLSCYMKMSLPDLSKGFKLSDARSNGVIDLISNELLSVGDPAAMVIQCEGQFFLAIIQINEILFDTSPVLEISPRFLVEPAVTVQFQIYQVVETSKDDPDVDSADWKWN